jgi:hypothetical protein
VARERRGAQADRGGETSPALRVTEPRRGLRVAAGLFFSAPRQFVWVRNFLRLARDRIAESPEQATRQGSASARVRLTAPCASPAPREPHASHRKSPTRRTEKGSVRLLGAYSAVEAPATAPATTRVCSLARYSAPNAPGVSVETDCWGFRGVHGTMHRPFRAALRTPAAEAPACPLETASSRFPTTHRCRQRRVHSRTAANPSVPSVPSPEKLGTSAHGDAPAGRQSSFRFA